MSTPRQQIDKWRQIRAGLPIVARNLLEDYAQAAVSLRKESSIETGINKDGKPGNKTAYSTKTVPSYLLKGKELNQSGRSYLDTNKTANWYGLRQAQGLRSPNVNLTYTGQMWANFKLLYIVSVNGQVTAGVGVTGQHADVFKHNIKRYGKFYQSTPDEVRRLTDDLNIGLSKWFSSHF